MISQAVVDGINSQITREFNASYVYLAMRAYFETRELTGFAHWMNMQSAEENAHAMRLYEYLLDRGGNICLGQIDAPPTGFESILDVFEQALSHEQQVTRDINSLYELALKEVDYPTQVELQWFITEQVEEESNAERIVERLKMVGDDPTGLLLLDQEVGARQAEGPAE